MAESSPIETATLEALARLEAARPLWDAEPAEEGLVFYPIPADMEQAAEEEAVIETVRRQAGRGRDETAAELNIARLAGPISQTPPAALGPCPLRTGAGETPAWETGLLLPPDFSLSSRRWAGEMLLSGLTAAHLSPPPGAPETRLLPVLALAAGWSAAPLAALWAGSGPVTILAEEELTAERSRRLAACNDRADHIKLAIGSFGASVRRRPDWLGHFGLILIRLSPYLIARRLKILARFLAPEGVILAAGFAPGFQTALILRAAGRAGLLLSGSAVRGDWAAVRLRPAPAEPARPPIDGSVVPALTDWPAEPEKPEEPADEE